MKRIFITLYALVAVVSALVAQPRFTSNTEMYSFGQIEWKHPSTVQYTITNTGDGMVALTNLKATGGTATLNLYSSQAAVGKVLAAMQTPGTGNQ